ncbi:MAG: CAP domain-containing protein [Verrucomicrobiales bacterium]
MKSSPPIVRHLSLFLLLGGSGSLCAESGKIPYTHGDPTPLEQFALEMANRARQAPLTESGDLGVDLNAGLSPNQIGGEAKQPLAFHPDLLAAARRHSLWMLEAKQFSHTGSGGSNAGERMGAAGYRFLAPYLWGENIAWQGVKGIGNPAELVRRLHRSIFASPTHRLNLLDVDHNSVGLGLQAGNYQFEGEVYQACFLTQNFARSAGSPEMAGPFVTGVAYRDSNGNGQYDPGEGKPGIRLSIEDGLYETYTTSSGGYALPILGPFGVRLRLIAEEPGRPRLVKEIEVLDVRNVKVDFVEPVIPRRVRVGASSFGAPVIRGD